MRYRRLEAAAMVLGMLTVLFAFWFMSPGLTFAVALVTLFGLLGLFWYTGKPRP
jgi:hypothetical protein